MKNKVKLMRLLKGLNQIELAKRSRVSRAAISIIERDLVEAKPETRAALAVALDCEAEWLFADGEIVTKNH